MTIEIKHAFTSAKGDGGDATLVRPSNWNAAHNTSMATGNLLGRLTAGVGAFEEIPISALVAAALDETTGAAFLAALGVGAFETGDIKMSIHPAASAGWIAYDGEGTIGKAGSGASVRANADTQSLYELIYTYVNDTFCPVSGGRTGNATNDFNAGKLLSLPRFSGRAIIGAGTGNTLTARVTGQYGGTETVTLTIAEMPSHTHGYTDPGHVHTYNYKLSTTAGPGGGGALWQGDQGLNTTSAGTNITINSNGGGGAHANMQPFVAMWVKVKL